MFQQNINGARFLVDVEISKFPELKNDLSFKL